MPSIALYSYLYMFNKYIINDCDNQPYIIVEIYLKTYFSVFYFFNTLKCCQKYKTNYLIFSAYKTAIK